MGKSPHLLIIGGGSAATSAAREMSSRGGRATLVHQGLPLGGCCLHVGCVPSKYMIRAAEQAYHARHPSFAGMTPRGMEVEEAALMNDLRKRIRELQERNYAQPLPKDPNIRLVKGWGRVVDGRTVEVNGERMEGDAVLIATGSRTDLADAARISSDRVLTNENLFEQQRLPKSVVVIGGGYIAVELSQMLNRLGVSVATLQRSETVLSSQPEYVGAALGGFLRSEGVDLHCGSEVYDIREQSDGVEVRARIQGREKCFTAGKVLMARGRLGNTETLNAEQAGVRVSTRGFVQVDGNYQTARPGIYAAGDVLGGHMLVYTATVEAERVAARLFGETVEPIRPETVPWVVFTDPQVAGVGLSEDEARERGLEVETAELPVDRWPRFSTIREHRGFLRLFRDPQTDTLLGARAVCPEAGDLISELALIHTHRIPLKTIARTLAPYLTLNEGIYRCAQKFHN